MSNAHAYDFFRHFEAESGLYFTFLFLFLALLVARGLKKLATKLRTDDDSPIYPMEALLFVLWAALLLA